jgi:hypothetical protein
MGWIKDTFLTYVKALFKAHKPCPDGRFCKRKPGSW